MIAGIRRALAPAAWSAVLLLAAGCGARAPVATAARFPTAPAEQGRCRVAASQTSPLVTEWPASEKANLEALLVPGGAGAVAVAYSGCSLRVLPQCRVRGTYRWWRTTPATDVIDINDQDELFAKLPLGAVSLEGELKRSGQLSVRTTVAGQLRLEDAAPEDVPAMGECATATHLVGALSVGAFALKAGGTATGKASAGVVGVEAGGGTDRGEKLVRSAGNPEDCTASSAETAHANCRSPIQVFLRPLPGRTPEEGPPGMVKVEFVADNPNQRWDVYADDVVICSTPCSKWIDPLRPVMLRSRSEGAMFLSPDKVTLRGLQSGGGAPVVLEAHGTANGMFMAGLGVGGVGISMIMVGAMLAGMTCGDDDPFFHSHCKPGLIVGGIGIPMAIAGAYLLVSSRPRAEVRRLDESARLRLLERRLVFGPGFVAGRF